MVNFLKYTFLVLAIGLVLLLLLWRQEGAQLKIEAANMMTEDKITVEDVKSTGASTILNKPRYSGRDNEGRQWTILADKAVQTGSLKEGVITLAQVYASYQNAEEQTDLSFEARNGIYTRGTDDTSETLVLENNVVIHGEGLTLKTDKLTTYVKTRSVIGDKPVHLQGSHGGYNIDLTAGGFQLLNNAERLTLTGGLKAKLIPQE